MKHFYLIMLFSIFSFIGIHAQSTCSSSSCGGFTSTPASVCLCSTLTFTTSYSSGVTWSVTNSKLLIVSSSSSSITVQGIAAGTGSISMSYNSNGTVCCVCKTITVIGSPGASITNFVPAYDLSYVKINSLPASSGLYYTWFIDGVQYGSEMLGGMQIAYHANCSQIYQVYVKIRNSCGTSTSSCEKFTLDCSTGAVTDLGTCGGGSNPIPCMGGKLQLFPNSNVEVQELSDPPYFSVFPNPVSDFMTIEGANEELEDVTLILRNVIGQELINTTSSTKTSRIDVSSYSNGVYFLSIKTDKGYETKKIAVNK